MNSPHTSTYNCYTGNSWHRCPDLYSRTRRPRKTWLQVLLKTCHRLRAVDNKNLNVIGSIIADISLDGPMKPTEIIYICNQVLKGFFLSQTAIKNLTLVDPHFPKQCHHTYWWKGTTCGWNISRMWLPNLITVPTTTGWYAIPRNTGTPEDLEQWIKSHFSKMCSMYVHINLCRKCWENRYPYCSYRIKNRLQFTNLSRYLTIGEIWSNSSIGNYRASPNRNSNNVVLQNGYCTEERWHTSMHGRFTNRT